VADRLHAALARRPVREEDFVTAVLLSVPAEGPARIVNCGHPSPLLLRGGRVCALDPPQPGPPLGLFDIAGSGCAARRAAFGPGETILLYTDGTTEARDGAGRFYPLAEDLAGAVFDGPEDLVDLVLAGLRRHVVVQPRPAIA
jgi:serine phosphatase RsbU (regulator of sigma subunit)